MLGLKRVFDDVLAGGGAGGRAVLHNCRFDGAGASAYGQEDILELFRREALALEEVTLVRGRRFAAFFADAPQGAIALFADLYDEHIARLWYLAPAPLQPQRTGRVDVAFDPSLGQWAPSVGFDPAEYPELRPEHVPRVLAMAACLIGDRTVMQPVPMRSVGRLTRLRPYVLRAFSSGESAAVLMVVTALRNDGKAGLVQFPIAALLPSDLSTDAVVVVDEGECQSELTRVWRPSL